VTFAASYVAEQRWLRGAASLSGSWTDRYEMDAAGLV
jgi:hypothetical protein